MDVPAGKNPAAGSTHLGFQIRPPAHPDVGDFPADGGVLDFQRAAGEAARREGGLRHTRGAGGGARTGGDRRGAVEGNRPRHRLGRADPLRRRHHPERDHRPDGSKHVHGARLLGLGGWLAGAAAHRRGDFLHHLPHRARQQHRTGRADGADLFLHLQRAENPSRRADPADDDRGFHRLHDAGGHAAERDCVCHRPGAAARNDAGGTRAEPGVRAGADGAGTGAVLSCPPFPCEGGDPKSGTARAVKKAPHNTVRHPSEAC